MAHFIDRRLNSKGKSTVNRQRFIRRYKQQIKKAVSDSISERSVTDIDSGESVSIPTRDISEPIFHTGKGGKREMVHPGNDQFSEGDKIQRPPGGGGGGGSGSGDASNSGEGADDFIFQISKDEYLDLLFEDLELPNLKKNQLNRVIQYKTHRAGYQTDGMPSNLDIVRSLKGSVARRIALTASKKKRVKELEARIEELKNDKHEHHLEIIELEKEIAELKRKIARVPFIDTFDLRFRNYEKRPQPTSKAVMFCLMDVSGSMDQETKDMAKRFYILLYLFLTRTYKDVEVVYIRHHTQAKEVDEQEFFYSQETGGTIVSSALKLMDEIVTDRYPSHEWNIYAAQASDGDNWADDSPLCTEILQKRLLNMVRYYAYIEITERQHQSLWREYKKVSEANSNFAMKHIRKVEDIYPVFRELFKKNVTSQEVS
ncbi:YeaH/YhbH family protein [Paraneptunicella aestuarii]|uniref:YeaH/YhbH family protein n=1 Tax=Paraneptunicella aestuarii TaxID=2831148 RepID=UPI001E5D094B|nr:YeaH/YhbH family protein [Paraneptunicella aestuarii]UAA37924.1 YeaH/YhbH family protein [Paraneptunicella aestuarii]